MSNNIIIVILVSLLLTSCFKKDEMIPAHEPGDVTTVVIPMTRYYTNQVYFNLENNEITSMNDRSIFDLNFGCSDTSTLIRLNTANFAMAAETNFKNFEDVTDTIGLIWKFDKSDGDIDSIALLNWINIVDEDTSYNNNVWVINRGISALGVNLGLRKVKFNKLESDKYYFTYANMDNSGLVESYVSKNSNCFYTQFSFDTNESNQTEPPKSDWDLLFTQYTTLLFTDDGIAYPYLVTGAIQKYENIRVALDTTLIFSEISLTDTSKVNFSTNFDKIGYDWKVLIGDVNTGDLYYEIKLGNNYFIEVDGLYYYKLRFINFYDHTTGEKGYPTFEYQKL